MATREIPREEWPAFFETFSRLHENWRVTIEALAADMGDQVEAEGLPLAEITAEKEPDGREVLSIILGAPGEPASVTKIIDNPRRVFLLQTDEELDSALEIEADDDMRLLLKLQEAMAPERLDGVVAKR
jgi:hypothetical protein